MEFTITRNEKTSLYEVHTAGCKHLTMSKHLTPGATVEAATGAEAAATFESRNDDCYTKLGPCAKALDKSGGNG